MDKERLRKLVKQGPFDRDEIQTKEKDQGKLGRKLSLPTGKKTKCSKPLKTATNMKTAGNVKMIVIVSFLSHTFSKRTRKVQLWGKGNLWEIEKCLFPKLFLIAVLRSAW